MCWRAWRRAGTRLADRHGCAGQPHGRDACLHYGCRTRSAADVAQRTRSRLSARYPLAQRTPHIAILVTGAAAVLVLRSWRFAAPNGLDVYGWMGSLATYGFIVAYALVCVALPRYLRAHGAAGPIARIVSLLAFAAMVLALAGNLYPVPQGIYGRLPFVFLAYLAASWLWVAVGLRNKRSRTLQS